MPAEATVRACLQSFHEALKHKLEVDMKLLEATRDVGKLMDQSDVDPDLLEQAVAQHAQMFAAARDAEDRTRRARYKLQQETGLAQCDPEQLRVYLQGHLPALAQRQGRTLVAGIESVVVELRAVTESLVELTGNVKRLLDDGLASVAHQTRTMARGRHAAHAYTSGRSAAMARFIDKRE